MCIRYIDIRITKYCMHHNCNKIRGSFTMTIDFMSQHVLNKEHDLLKIC